MIFAPDLTPEQAVRWAWLRAVEWIGWPEFISQPVVPTLLYFLPWPSIFSWLVVLAVAWRAFVVPYHVSPRLSRAGMFFVLTKFLTAPLMCYLLWRRGDKLLAVVALLWPLLGPFLVQFVLTIPVALLNLTRRGQYLQIGDVQRRLLAPIGMDTSASTDER